MHPLKKYLSEVSEPVASFAARVGASRQTLYRIFSGAHTPRPSLARRIVEATGGAVSFEALYGRREDRADIVFLTRNQTDTIDRNRLSIAIAIVCSHLTPAGMRSPPEDAYMMASEAAANTFVALASVTTRIGTDRLQQALRPVIEEFLTEYCGLSRSDQAHDQAARLAADLYLASEIEQIPEPAA
ncbi:MAG: helix-turn-helix transcriptional regulator [Pseudomonadota bacterium]